MDFQFEPLAIVEKKKKYTSFKITPIGGPEEIETWRQMQEARASTYRMRLDTRDKRLSTFEEDLGAPIDRGYVTEAKWETKLAEAMAEREALRRREEDALRIYRSKEQSKITLPDYEPQKPLGIYKRFLGLMKRVWVNANF